MPLTPDEIVLYQARLTEAEDALHKLLIGNSARVYVDQNGERVEYNAANAARLRAYIMELKIALGNKSVPGPMRVGMV